VSLGTRACDDVCCYLPQLQRAREGVKVKGMTI
jgi:hypothetical protein